MDETQNEEKTHMLIQVIMYGSKAVFTVICFIFAIISMINLGMDAGNGIFDSGNGVFIASWICGLLNTFNGIFYIVLTLVTIWKACNMADPGLVITVLDIIHFWIYLVLAISVVAMKVIISRGEYDIDANYENTDKVLTDWLYINSFMFLFVVLYGITTFCGGPNVALGKKSSSSSRANVVVGRPPYYC